MSDYSGEYSDRGSPPPYRGWYQDSDEDMMDAPENNYENDPRPLQSKPRKAPATSKPIVKKCRTCGNAGHDSRNCAINKGFTGKDRKPKEKPAKPAPLPPPPPPVQQKVPKPSKPAEEKACGACREIGHDRRVCPKLLGVPERQKQEVVAVVQRLMDNMTTSPAPAKAKSKAKKEASTGAGVPKKQTAKSSRGQAAEKQSKTTKRSKATNPLSAGIAKKPKGSATTKKKAPLAAVKNNSINFTINLG
ncbi:hypothetical protein TWF730_001019 [Orbilia blumenaviensis]|uniref:CCHC-type domain-containing protein n=1 Tax=Orbilia blumenaviensis TaxID=1796055 RepID=A0AAV9VR10_9PEZI